MKTPKLVRNQARVQDFYDYLALAVLFQQDTWIWVTVCVAMTECPCLIIASRRLWTLLILSLTRQRVRLTWLDSCDPLHEFCISFFWTKHLETLDTDMETCVHLNLFIDLSSSLVADSRLEPFPASCSDKSITKTKARDAVSDLLSPSWAVAASTPCFGERRTRHGFWWIEGQPSFFAVN